MSPRTRKWLTLLCVIATVAGCKSRERNVRVGAKAFSESRLLAEVLRATVADEGAPVDRVVECGDTWSCHRALRSGAIDLLVDYTGTGQSLLGTAATDGALLPQLRRAYEPQGITWTEPLGFDNGYVVLVTATRAAAEGWATIADLAPAGALRVACPPEFVRRPSDGLGALAGRYGLQLATSPTVDPDPATRYDRLARGDVDVAVGYATDPALDRLGLVPLRDDLEFFPPYDAVVLAAAAALQREPALRKAAERLTGQIDVAAMRTLNAQVQIQGRDPATVAGEFLVAAGLLTAPPASNRRAPLHVAMAPGESFAALRTQAVLATRRAFPERAVEVLEHPDPLGAVADGRARLALVDAEAFFPAGATGSRDARARAAAVVGVRAIHILRRRDGTQATLAARVGVPSGIRGGATLALATARPGAKESAQPTRTGGLEDLLAELRAGRLDIVVTPALVGDARLAAALGAGDLELVPVPDAAGATGAAPWRRQLRIPAHTYADQPAAIDSVGTQVVLAGPAPGAGGVVVGGPAAALPGAAAPLTVAEVEALAAGTAVGEAPHPALPVAWSDVHSPDAATTDRWRVEALVDLALNILAIAFLAWLGVLLFRRPERAA